MVKRDKCESGYLKYKKQLWCLISIISIIVIAVVLVTGIIIFKSKNNYMTVVSAVLALPAAKFIVNFLVLLPHKSTDSNVVEEVNKHKDTCNALYDIVMSAKDKMFGIQAVVITDTHICVYTIEAKADKVYFENAVKEFLKKDKLSATISVYSDYKQFLKRIDGVTASFDNSEQSQNRMKWLTDSFKILVL